MDLPGRILTLEYLIEQEENTRTTSNRFCDQNEEDETRLIDDQKNVNTTKKTTQDIQCFQVISKLNNVTAWNWPHLIVFFVFVLSINVLHMVLWHHNRAVRSYPPAVKIESTT